MKKKLNCPNFEAGFVRVLPLGKILIEKFFKNFIYIDGLFQEKCQLFKNKEPNFWKFSIRLNFLNFDGLKTLTPKKYGNNFY